MDPGHGGRDPGAVANQLQEKDLTLTLARRVGDILQQEYRVDVALTRSTDEFVSLADRSAFANASGADYFVSIHINSGGGKGYEDYIQAGLADSSAAAVCRSAVHATVAELLRTRGVTDRGEKQKNLHVLRETHMPALLTENLCIDNTSDAALLRRNAFLNELAEPHARGIARVLGLRRRRLTITPSTRLLARPRATRSQAERYLLSHPHGEYSDRSVRRIAQHYFDTAGRRWRRPTARDQPDGPRDRQPDLTLVAGATPEPGGHRCGPAHSLSGFHSLHGRRRCVRTSDVCSPTPSPRDGRRRAAGPDSGSAGLAAGARPPTWHRSDAERTGGNLGPGPSIREQDQPTRQRDPDTVSDWLKEPARLLSVRSAEGVPRASRGRGTRVVRGGGRRRATGTKAA